MASSKSQRWSILIILIALVIGTLGSFAVMVLSMRANQAARAEYQKLQAEYEKETAEYRQKKQAQDDELSSKYYEVFSAYSGRVEKFEIDSVKALETEDLVEGAGATIDGGTKFAAYYIGWDANGNIFDQSIQSDKLKEPFAISGLDSTSVIAGWKEGLKGMKIGGVRLLTIPSDKAYGESGSKDSDGNQKIAPNMPLKFIVMAIDMPEEIPQPDMSKLIEAYTKLQGNQ